MKLDLSEVITRLGYECSIDDATVEMCVRRFKNEGMPFLTKALPKLSKAIIFSLEKGWFIRPTNFAWKGSLLVHFRPLLSKIFNSSGGLLEDADALAIKLLRQFCEYFYKLAMPFEDKKLEEAEAKFAEVDSQVPSVGDYDESFVDQLRKDFETYFRPLSSASTGEILSSCPPRAGSGTFSQYGYAKNQKDNSPWYVKRYLDFSSPENWEHYHYSRRLHKVGYDHSIVRGPNVSEVLFVPKDSRGPRTIVREPFHALAYQMSYFDFVSSSLEYHSRHRINFQDQQINRDLALSASIDKKMCTIDLESASDRVSYAVVKHIFRHSPGLLQFVLNRTSQTVLPSGKIMCLRKLAGMGSGLTFPTMSLLCFLAIVRHVSTRTGLPWLEVAKQVYTYGDDIICPSHWYRYAANALACVGLVVNKDKSFVQGYFRESCGADYFKGQDVSIVRAKFTGSDPTPHFSASTGTQFLKLDSTRGIIDLDSHCCELIDAGLNKVAEYYYSLIEKEIGSLPFKSSRQPYIARYVKQLPASYFGSTGVYQKIRVYAVTSLKVEVDSEEYFLGQALRDSKRVTWKELLFPDSVSPHSSVGIPRKVTLRRKKINPLALV